jgi:sugar phosphate isomerase/epimerase
MARNPSSLAFSTCWNAHRHTNGEHFTNEVLLLGFEAVEFSHGFGRELITSFQKEFDKGRIKVSGARHPCPARAKEDDHPLADLLSLDNATRKLAVQQVMASINQVDSFSGDYLLLPFHHFSTSASTARLLQMLKAGDLHTRSYVTEKLGVIKAREQDADFAMDLAREALRELVPYAEARGVRLALENRARYEQFPTAREIETLLSEFPKPALGYWHDFGHAERQAQIGFLDHAEQIERLASHTIGCHINDLVWPDQDHAVPGQGMIDFADLIPRLPKEAHVVWEIQPRRKAADIKAALAKWCETFPSS